MGRVLAVSCVAMLLTACHGSADNAGNTPTTGPAPLSTAVASVTMSVTSARLQVGESLQLMAQPRSLSGAVTGATYMTWYSTASTIASVTPNGLVTALSVGSAAIVATADGHSNQTAITVYAAAVTAR